MPDLLVPIYRRASQCPFACFLKILFAFSFVMVLHIALYHQADVSPYIYALLVDLLGIIAILALAFNRNCRVRMSEADTENLLDPVKPTL